MFSASEIIRNNNNTFYNYASSQKTSQRRRIITLLIISSLLIWAIPVQSNDFLNAVITAQAILVGFSFSVLFFLLSNSDIQALPGESIERSLRRAKLNKLCREIFHNVSYYNFVSIISVVLSLLFMSEHPNRKFICGILSFINKFISLDTSYAFELIRYSWSFLYIIVGFFLYASLAESIYTFFRTTLRVGFYFQEKLKLTDAAP